MAQTALDHVTRAKDTARQNLSRYLEKAVQTLVDSMDSDNERIALAAAESVLDRLGVGKTQQHEVQVSQVEHDQAKVEAEKLVADLARNVQGQLEAAPTPELDTIIVLESDVEELPVAEPRSYQEIIDAEARLDKE